MSALLSVKSAAEDIVLAKSATRPNVGLSVDGTNSISGTIGSDALNTTQRLDVQLSYRHTLFDNFKTDAQVEQARALVELSTYTLANEEQNVLLSVVQAYLDVYRDTQLVKLRQDSVEFFDQQVDAADEQLRVGAGTKIDVSQAQARRAQAVALYRSAIASLATSQASFERWVGHKPKNLVVEFPYARLLPKTVDAAIALAVKRHPAILSAQAAIRASQAGSDAARAAFGPTLNLIGSICGLCYTANQTYVGGNQALSSQGTTYSGSLSISLSVPLYSGGALGASVRKANIEQIKSEVQALDARDRVRESVISSWNALQNAVAQIQSAQSAIESGDLVLTGIIEERNVGQRTTLDVLNAQAELTTAKVAQIQATVGRVLASFALISATGGLSAQNLGLKVEIKSAAGYIATVEDIWQDLRAIDE